MHTTGPKLVRPENVPIPIACAVDDCPITTEVFAAHSGNLAGRWKCRSTTTAPSRKGTRHV